MTPAVSAKFERLGLLCCQDLLLHFPSRYEDRTHLMPLSDIQEGVECLVQGQIVHVDRPSFKKRPLVLTLQEGNALVRVLFFRTFPNQAKAMQEGLWMRCYGAVRSDKQGLHFSHPDYQLVRSLPGPPLLSHQQGVYPTTQGLPQRTVQKFINIVIDNCLPTLELEDKASRSALSSFELWPVAQSLSWVHRPPPDMPIGEDERWRHPAWQRLILEELCAYHYALRQARDTRREKKAPSFPLSTILAPDFLKALPFPLTSAQERVCKEIANDLMKNVPMMRLVQGDVGSGKTVLAAMAALQAMEQGKQVALMAPTEILAVQHYQNFTRWLAPLGKRCACLLGNMRVKPKREIRAGLASGEIHLLIGTHALFQSDVEFKDLGLNIIDEQHRFGVQQRLALYEKGSAGVHQLVMSATPIPRTLAMTYYADLDVSLLDELPPGREPIQTLVVPQARRDMVIDRVAKACEKGEQAYWVCTLVETSEILDCQAAEDAANYLKEQLPNLRIGLVHGRLKPKEKDEILHCFRAQEYDVLVATTVVEVGLDVPRATLMIVENPERLGLAQLHQLRGRVGRGSQKGYCILLYQPPLSLMAKERLAVLRETQDGFVIAEKDLSLRGAGEVLGTRQTGALMFKLANCHRDQDLFPRASHLVELLEKTSQDVMQHWVARWQSAHEVLTQV